MNRHSTHTCIFPVVCVLCPQYIYVFPRTHALRSRISVSKVSEEMIVVPKETPSGTKVDVINADNSGFGSDFMLVLDSVEVCET